MDKETLFFQWVQDEYADDISEDGQQYNRLREAFEAGFKAAHESRCDCVVREAIAMVLENAGKRFTGEIAYNFTAADGYANANDISSELFFMAEEYRTLVDQELSTGQIR